MVTADGQRRIQLPDGQTRFGNELTPLQYRLQRLGTGGRRVLARNLAPRFPPDKHYIPHVPHPPQQAFLLLNQFPEVFYGGAAGGGKGHPISAGKVRYHASTGQQHDADISVVTPWGFKPFGDVRVGDQLVNPDGSVQRVIALHELGDREVFRVTFTDGASTLVTGDHLWLVNRSGKRLKAQRRYPTDEGWSGNVGAVIRTTEQLAADLAVCHTAAAAGQRPHWPLIPLTEPVEFQVTARHPAGRWPIAPYLLGVLIGDGHCGTTSPSFYSADLEIADRVRAEGTELRYVERRAGQGAYFLDDKHLTRAALRTLNLACGAATKRIPDAYLHAPLVTRWALAQGLFDTDGTADSRGHVSYTTISEGLARDIAWLVRSLGFKATTTDRITQFTGRDQIKQDGQRAYNVTVAGDRCPDLFHLARKRDRCRTGINGGDRAKRRMIHIESVGYAPSRCITVDHPNGLYITDDFVVTHNSDAGLMAVLQYVDVPGYSALVLRRTFADLALPGAIMNRAITWLQGTDARMKDGGKLWHFPTEGADATLQFGYAQTHADVYRYQGAEFQTIFMDELTHFEDRTYLYLFSRLRGPALPCLSCGHGTSQPAGEPRQHDEGHDDCRCGHEHLPDRPCGTDPNVFDCECMLYRPASCPCLDPTPDRRSLKAAADGLTLADVPLRMRSGSNPGGVGHEWVRRRFIDASTREQRAVFVPAKLNDNPSLDRKAYRSGLSRLTAVERARLEEGDWSVQDDGDVFQRAWFRIVDDYPADCRLLRFWDFAATAVKQTRTSGKKDPDYTVGALVGLSSQGQLYVVDVRRFRKSPFDTEAEVKQVAQLDGRRIAVRIEQEPGSSGVTVVDHWRRGVFVGYDFDGIRPTLSKEERARPVASAAEAGNVFIVSAPWNREFLDEFAGFPNLNHDDQVDAVSGAVGGLVGARRARIIA